MQAGLPSPALLDLLLGAEVVGVSALLLAAVDGTGVQAGVAPGGGTVHITKSPVSLGKGTRRKVPTPPGGSQGGRGGNWDVLAADHFVTVVLLGELAERGLDDAPPQAQHQVQGGL